MKNYRQVSKQGPATPDQAHGPADGRDPPGEGVSFPIVGVGASAGGLEAFTQLLKSLPLDTGMGFVLVQHLDPEHESALTQILSRATKLPVSEITHNQPVEPNHVHIIPRDASLSIAQGVLKLGPRQKTRAPHRPIDSFFESLAQDQRDRAIGVVLSGTASDGTLGLEAIKAEGGITFAQDDSAKHDSMPRSAVAAGCVDLVLSPAGIAKELVRIAKHPYTAGQSLAGTMRAQENRAQATAHQDDLAPPPSGGRATPRSGNKRARGPAGADEDYKKILLLLRNHSGVDFSLYKSSTLQRRINRRVILTKHTGLAGYAGFLRGNAKELDALYSDVLISVTSFFRNPEMFDALQRTVLPELLKQRGADPLRCWVLGCSTGQEAYSIAMSFVEAAENAPRRRSVQIFATDLNEALLDKARHGLYAKSLAEEIAPERLRRFFVEEQGGYRVSKLLREMVVFARQNLIADPPFSRIDLISCRNLLIYLEPSLQKKALPTFHYALKPHGFLLLGASESVGGFTELFEPVDKKHKIYSRKPAPTPALHLPVSTAHREQPPPGRRPGLPMAQADALEPPEALRGELNAQREADRITINQFAPPGVLVDAELQVLQFRGPTGAYLQPAAGKASFNVLKMAREGLMLPLRAAVNQARKENKTARRANVRVKRNGKTHTVNLEVIPLKNLREPCLLIVFEEAEKSARAGGRTPPDEPPPTPPASKQQERSRIAELETDLAEMREYLQSLQEQHEAANEELQAASEETQSTNEELQSINEELETSKEELESANEELITVNEEMNHRNVELNRLNSELVSLQASTQNTVDTVREPLLVLDSRLRVENANRAFYRSFHITSTEAVGRYIYDLGNRQWDIPRLRELLEELLLQHTSIEDYLVEHDFAQGLGRRAMLLNARRIQDPLRKSERILLAIEDITERKHSEEALRRHADQFQTLLYEAPFGVYLVDADFRIRHVNPTTFQVFGDLEVIGRDFDEVIHILWPQPYADEIVQRFRHTLETGEPYMTPERGERRLDRGVTEYYAWQINRVPLPEGRYGVVCYFRDISAQVLGQQALRDSEERFRMLADNIAQLAWTADAKGWIYWYNQRWYDYTATTLEQMQGWGWKTVHHPDHVDRVVERIQHAWDTGEPWEDTFPLRGADGTYRWFLSRALPIRDEQGKVLRWFGTNTDVTEQREMESRIKQQAEQLTDESQRKDEFLAMLGHELRNPLAAIHSAVHLLRVHERGSENLIQRQTREIIERQVANLSKLVGDLLEVSRVVSGRIRLDQRTVDLNQVVRHATETIKPLIEQRRHTLVLKLGGEPIWANVDAMRMEEVFINLLNNAAKYTDEGGRIEIHCEHAPGRTDYAQIRVRDDGMGIDKELLPRIFDLFTQADRSLARAAGGLGIGLSLAQRLVDLHGGTLEAHSPPQDRPSGGGSEFIVKLSLTHAPETPQSVEPDAATAPQRDAMRVLVVDDNSDQAMMLSSVLQHMGCSVRSAHTGADGLQVALQWRPDIMLLDIGLPDLDGYEVARRLRSDPGMKTLQLIALTGYARDSDIALTREAGFDAHLSKPLEFAELEKLMRLHAQEAS